MFNNAEIQGSRRAAGNAGRLLVFNNAEIREAGEQQGMQVGY